MPSIAENLSLWDQRYGWQQDGEEWSVLWGGADMQWHGSLLPRIHAFVPTGTIVEIACGHGRWTRYLGGLCDRLIAVDLSGRCVDATRARLASLGHVEVHQNDGKSLPFVADRSVDLVFSFDSLVHVDAGVIRAYVAELARVLADDGVAFIHHSNLGEPTHPLLRIPGAHGLAKRTGLLPKVFNWRDPSVSAALVQSVAQEHGLHCISQEKLDWVRRFALVDCISVIVREGSSRDRATRVLSNPRFMDEGRRIGRLARLYGAGRPR